MRQVVQAITGPKAVLILKLLETSNLLNPRVWWAKIMNSARAKTVYSLHRRFITAKIIILRENLISLLIAMKVHLPLTVRERPLPIITILHLEIISLNKRITLLILVILQVRWRNKKESSTYLMMGQQIASVWRKRSFHIKNPNLLLISLP